MNDIDRAKTLLDNGFTCVLVNADNIYTSTLNGVAPMMDFISSGINLSGFSAADKIVGKAAAMLFVLAGVKAVFAPVMSKNAVKVFSGYGINYSCGIITDSIVNRNGSGPCPMDKAVSDTDDPHAAYYAIRHTLDQLKSEKNEICA
jgi:hypothetical protein